MKNPKGWAEQPTNMAPIHDISELTILHNESLPLKEKLSKIMRTFDKNEEDGWEEPETKLEEDLVMAAEAIVDMDAAYHKSSLTKNKQRVTKLISQYKRLLPHIKLSLEKYEQTSHVPDYVSYENRKN